MPWSLFSCIFSVLFSIVITLLGKERPGLCVSRLFIVRLVIVALP